MAEPTSQLTMLELCTKIAKDAGNAYRGPEATSRSMLPIDKDDLADIVEVINDGVRMFIADAPPSGWKWPKRIMSVPISGTKIEGTVDSSSVTTLVDATLSTASGTADSASATTIVDATLSATYDTDDELVGYYCYIISGTGAGSYALITDYDASTGTITVADWLTAGGKPGGTDPDAGSTFGISVYKVLVGYYCYISAGTGIGSYAPITGFDSSDGTITVADWLDAHGNAGGTDPTAGSTFVITTVEIVAGDIGRYPLAENFGGEVSGQITYAKDTSHTQRITWVPESEIRLKRQLGDSAGYPYLAAIRQVEPSSSSSGPKRRYELLLWPDPSADDILEFPYPLIFDKLDIESGITTSVTAGSYILADSTREEADDYFDGWLLSIIGGTGKGQSAVVDDYVAATGSFTFLVGTWFSTVPDTTSVYIVEPINNLHPAGIKFDNVVKSACLAKAEMKFTNFTTGHVDEYIQKDLPKAYQADARSVMHTKIGKKEPYRRVWKDVEKI